MIRLLRFVANVFLGWGLIILVWFAIAVGVAIIAQAQPYPMSGTDGSVVVYEGNTQTCTGTLQFTAADFDTTPSGQFCNIAIAPKICPSFTSCNRSNFPNSTMYYGFSDSIYTGIPGAVTSSYNGIELNSNATTSTASLTNFAAYLHSGNTWNSAGGKQGALRLLATGAAGGAVNDAWYATGDGEFDTNSQLIFPAQNNVKVQWNGRSAGYFTSVFAGSNQLTFGSPGRVILASAINSSGLGFIAGHPYTVQTTGPTITAGGGTGNSLATGSTDAAGFINLGTGSPTTVTLTFAQAWTHRPVCSAEVEGSFINHHVVTTTTTMIVSTDTAFTDSTAIGYSCRGYTE